MVAGAESLAAHINNGSDSQESTMTDQTAHQKAGVLTREEVAEYLKNNPDFFVD